MVASIALAAVTTPTLPPDDLPEQMRVRREKLRRLQEEGVDPYAFGYPCTASIPEVRARFCDLDVDVRTGERVAIAGRVVLNRVSGKIIFAQLRGAGEDLQVMLTLDASGIEALDRWKTDVDLGDHVGVVGEVITSKRGELSVLASDFTITSKCLRPLPRSMLASATQKHGSGSAMST